MASFLLWTTLLSVSCLGRISSGLECQEVDTNMCSCFEYEVTEIQCPRRDHRINISVTRKDQITIQCQDPTMPYLDATQLPSMNLSDSKSLKIEYCFMNSSFRHVIDKFGIRNLSMLTFETSENDGDTKFTNETLKSLESLESLSVAYSTLHLEKDFLVNNQNLLVLYMSKNSMTELDKYFDYVPKLRLLDLSSNHINSLPDGVFEKLANLSKLQLFGNNISSIARSKFTGLDNLKLLELSCNQIEALPEDTFADLKNLVNISLRSNRIKKLYGGIFANNKLLENIRLDHNTLVELEGAIFANLTALRTIELNGNKLDSVQENLFEECRNLKDIDLSENALTSVPNGLFKDTRTLKVLNLAHNNISHLSDEVFSSLENLQILKLYGNQLTTISEKLFRNLDALEYLDVHGNMISEIRIKAFETLQKLIYLDLSRNQWNNMYHLASSPLNMLTKIEVLLVSHNQLTEFPLLPSALYLKTFDLSHNLINYVSVKDFVHTTTFEVRINLRYNQIRLLDFNLTKYLLHQNLGQNNGGVGGTILDIRNNSIICDCSNYGLIVYNNETELKALVNIIQDDLVCFNDNKTKVLDLLPKDVKCPVMEGCPDGCSCYYKSMNSVLVVDCSFRNLTLYPSLVLGAHLPYKQTYLLLRGNRLTKGPTGKEQGYDNITLLDLSKNSIAELDWIPPRIENLNLQENELENFDEHFVARLKNATSLERLQLKSNPWVCGCQSAALQEYLRHYFKKVNTSDVTCTNVKGELLKVIICTLSPYLTILLPVVLGVLLCMALAFVIYYRYQTEIKVYLYAKNMCLWFVSEEELDKDKTYDVFISYAHQDQKFVEEYLLPELERKDHPYKVCIHIRDWIPGEFIAEQVVNSVRDSRRTLVVLSDNFVESVWGKLEFRTAHTEAIAEGRARVIVVIFGELNESKLDDELKSYLKTNTYVKWGEKYFWNKLKYALPHSRGNFYEANKKHAKVMLKIDDKFDLIKNPPSPSNTSTPPITLDPAFLECKDLAINLEKKIEGEYPLLVTSA